jgi:hypothetical protein
MFCGFTLALFVVPNTNSSLISFFPFMLLRYCLNDFEIVSVSPIKTVIIFLYYYYCHYCYYYKVARGAQSGFLKIYFNSYLESFSLLSRPECSSFI